MKRFRKYWWIPTIALVVGVICFTTWVEIRRSVEGSFAHRVFDFLDGWALILSAAVTLFLAIAAFLSIMELRSARRDDLRTRGLEDIIEWTESTQRYFKQLEAFATMADGKSIELGLESIRAKSRSIVRIALGVGGENLKLLAEDLTNNIDAYLNEYNTIAHPQKLKEIEGKIRQNVKS